MVSQNSSGREDKSKRQGRPKLPRSLKRIAVNSKVSPETLDFIQGQDAPNDGRAIDLIVQKYRSVFGAPRQLRQKKKLRSVVRSKISSSK